MLHNYALRFLALVVLLSLLLTACTPAATPTATDAPTAASNEATANGTITATQPSSDALPSAGTPLAGAPGNPPPGAGSGGSSIADGLATATGAYTLDGKTADEDGLTLIAENDDQSGIYVLNGGALTLSNAAITTGGNTSSDENSSFYGLNAGVLANNSTISLTDSTINTTGSGANGAFAAGSTADVTLTDVTITASGDGGHGVMATQGGKMTLANVTITTSGAHSAPIATDRGSGTVDVAGSNITTTGADSPCYYSTGNIIVADSTCDAVDTESIVVEGTNLVALLNSDTTSSSTDKWGVMVYQSFSGDAEGSHGTVMLQGGSILHDSPNGPLFYVTNATATIALSDVVVTAVSGTLAQAAANDRWGTSGSNGGHLVLTADTQTLKGDIIADSLSSLDVILTNNSVWEGALNYENLAQSTHIILDTTSTWKLTDNSFVTCLADGSGLSGSTVTNIVGNGFTLYYDAASCTALNGQTYSLSGGGSLTPAS